MDPHQAPARMPLPMPAPGVLTAGEFSYDVLQGKSPSRHMEDLKTDYTYDNASQTSTGPLRSNAPISTVTHSYYTVSQWNCGWDQKVLVFGTDDRVID
ncbi:hypothetical protein [Rhizohabitans arisaemae]|uniref:hypothetical protein n=1 Tax=Rhizohabitans arisaemae TaxID=2720610 RepID=UPI0024B116EE|nr:hypothetical protein [Rhizohabitans arisaemae]